MLMVLASVQAAETVHRIFVDTFTELTVVDGVNVDYYCRPDSAGWAVFVCEPEMAPKITFSNNSRRLSIQTDADEVALVGVPRVTVYSTSLVKVENSGDSLLRVFVTEPVKTFKAKQIGNGSLEVHNIKADHVDAGITAGKGSLSIDGTAAKATISNVSTGPIDASKLDADEVKCVIFGTGDIDCSPKDKLRIYGAGSGAIYYHVNPAKIANRGIGVKAYADGEGPRAAKRAKDTAAR